jgi:cell fate regulator YaaT (PSP1 superfamily)
MHLIEVAFKGNRKEFYAWDGEEPPAVRASIIVEADRGEDLGTVHAVGEHAQKRCVGCSHGLGSGEPTRKALRVASTRELRQHREIRAQDETARQKAAGLVKTHGLVMKLSDAEWQWDRKKLTFYFTADKRVDFRDLVRDLAATFRARIELKQIGVRDEAKRLDGVGRCGRQFCSASWLPELRPVNLGVAKDQHLSLNPSQISGACGRLMCCLRYEHELYVESRKRFPKEGKTLVTARGEEKVVANEIFNERVTLRSADGESRVIKLAELRRELAAVGQPLAGADASALDSADLAATSVEPTELESELVAEVTESYQSVDTFDLEIEDTSLADRRPNGETGPQRAGSRAAGPEAAGRGDWTPRSRPRGDRRGQSRETPAAAPDPRTPAIPQATAPDAPSPGSAAPSPAQPDEPSAAGNAPRRRRGRRGGRRGRGKGGGNGNGSPGPDGQNRPDGTSGGPPQSPPPGAS